MAGTVYWVTGLSGAGKTTIGSLIYDKIKLKKDNIVLLDGDILRNIFRCTSYSNAKRKELAFKYSELCSMLAKQEIDVVICTIAMFDDVRTWNRQNIDNYKEIYLKVPMNVLIERDQKGLYSRAIQNEVTNVLGINMEFEEPKYSDLTIINDGELKPNEVLDIIVKKLVV